MSDLSAREFDPTDDLADGHPGLERPTAVRHAVVGIATSMSILLYLDRFCVSFAERYIREELNLSNAQMGLFLSMFFWTYAIAQVPSGWLSDRFGPRKMLCLYILAWSIFTGGLGLVNGFVMLLVMRAGCGLAQAGAYPSCGTLLSRWSPLSSRARASSIVALGGRIGGMIAPLLTGLLMVQFVPVSQSSLFTDAELLKPITLAHHLVEPAEVAVKEEGTEVIRTVTPRPDWEYAVSLLTSVDREIVTSVAEHPIPASAANSNRAPEVLSDKERAAMLGVVNDLIAREDFYNPEAYTGIDFSDEADNLIEEQQHRSLTPKELTRRNRLIAEALFPDALGKLYVNGWRPVMITYGLIGIFVAAAVWIVYRDNPSQHPWCNDAERRLIKGVVPTQGTAGARPAENAPPKATGIPWRAILSSGSIWCSSVSQFLINVGWLFIVTWFPRYLADVHHVPIETRSLMASIPMGCGIAGLFLGGMLTDFLTRRIGMRWGRGLPITVNKLFAMLAFLSCLWLDSPWAVTVAMACVAFSTDLGIAGLWAFCQDVGGRHVGSVLGFGNMWGNFGAALSPLLLNAIVENYSWNGLFIVCALAFGVSGIASAGIDCTKPIVPDEMNG